MKCPKCMRSTRVYETRRRRDGAVLRRRQCEGRRCYMKFATLERLANLIPKRRKLRRAAVSLERRQKTLGQPRAQACEPSR